MPPVSLVHTIINDTFMWYALHQSLVRGSLRVSFIIVSTIDRETERERERERQRQRGKERERESCVYTRDREDR